MSAQGTNDGGSEYKSRPRTSGDSRRRFDSKEGGRSQGERQFNNGSRYDRSTRPKSDKPKFDRTKSDRNRPATGRRDNDYGKFMKDKDDDERDNSRRSKPTRPKENKSAIAQPDKAKTQLRLEKEQKTMKKKQDFSSKKKESSRPQPKKKRSNNINYTREYMNGAFDDYEVYDDEY